MQTAIAMEKKDGREMFSEMAKAHHRELLVYARALVREESDARDLVQESLLAAWKSMARFDVTKDAGAWLRGIVRNKWKDYCRRMGRKPAFAEKELGELEAVIIEAGTGEAGPWEALKNCREKLPVPLAEAIHDFYYEGLTGDEAAGRAGIQPATLRKRLERAREALRECLENNLKSSS